MAEIRKLIKKDTFLEGLMFKLAASHAAMPQCKNQTNETEHCCCLEKRNSPPLVLLERKAESKLRMHLGLCLQTSCERVKGDGGRDLQLLPQHKNCFQWMQWRLIGEV